MSFEQVQYHYVYKITNIMPTDERTYYIGVRSSTKEPLNDNYLGSSKSLKKHMSDCYSKNFTKEILRIDGTGYPFGLNGNEICLEAKIVAVADVFDAISSHRPYRASLGSEYAIDELKHNSGTKYDTTIVKTLVALVEENIISC